VLTITNIRNKKSSIWKKHIHQPNGNRKFVVMIICQQEEIFWIYVVEKLMVHIISIGM